MICRFCNQEKKWFYGTNDLDKRCTSCAKVYMTGQELQMYKRLLRPKKEKVAVVNVGLKKFCEDRGVSFCGFNFWLARKKKQLKQKKEGIIE